MSEPTEDEIKRVLIYLASKTSDRKKITSAENGRKGGRPPAPLSDIACNCGMANNVLHASTCLRGRAQRRRL